MGTIPGKRVFLLIHGLGDSGQIWSGLSSALAPIGPVWTPDLPGHGSALEAADGSYTLDAYTEAIEAYIADREELASGNLLVVGHSLGGAVAARLLLAAAAAAIFLDWVPSGAPDAIRHIRADLAGSLGRWSSLDSYAAWLKARRPLLNEKAALELARIDLRPDSPGFVRNLDPRVLQTPEHNPDSLKLMEQIAMKGKPFCTIRGIGSAVVSPTAFQAAVRNTACVGSETVDRAGHSLMVDNPVGCLEAVLRCVHRLSR